MAKIFGAEPDIQRPTGDGKTFVSIFQVRGLGIHMVYYHDSTNCIVDGGNFSAVDDFGSMQRINPEQFGVSIGNGYSE